ncbi:hypothetical protein E2C01_049092 [Portunus trituberculatus]|uniref:Uncharacterized protein n=1 Tax=Portunus trituberculatus TaxID=210409 RepID=A0A5B7G5A7_PORTR|nr:hypothetical protein [Portunus trituberculatus]
MASWLRCSLIPRVDSLGRERWLTNSAKSHTSRSGPRSLSLSGRELPVTSRVSHTYGVKSHTSRVASAPSTNEDAPPRWLDTITHTLGANFHTWWPIRCRCCDSGEITSIVIVQLRLRTNHHLMFCTQLARRRAVVSTALPLSLSLPGHLDLPTPPRGAGRPGTRRFVLS